MTRARVQSSVAGKRRVKHIKGPWVQHRLDLITSPAWRTLSLQGRRFLERLEVEHMHHAGTANGRLIVTWDDFKAFGVRRNSIMSAQLEARALGLVVVTQRGSGGNSDFRRPNEFRLTYLPTQFAPPTDEWKLIVTIEDAKRRVARLAGKATRKTKAAPQNDTGPTPQNDTETARGESENGGNPRGSRSNKKGGTLYILPGGRGGGSPRAHHPVACDVAPAPARGNPR